MQKLPKLIRYKENVEVKYHIYNSILATLPFDNITKTGVLLPLFHNVCKEGFSNKKNPEEIVTYFFKVYGSNLSEEEKINLLFKFIQYIERQVVLFDAIEDASFKIVNNMDGVGTLRYSKETAALRNKEKDLKKYLNSFKIRIVLTAHPTQFYPGTVLGIITDLTKAIQKNNLIKINQLLSQLGKTPFFKKKKPTPFDEAINLIWYLENIFYHSVSKTYSYIKNNIIDNKDNEVINLGFWPGGDRDGNPFVTTEITLDVARRLRQSILKNYYKDMRSLKRRLTFYDVDQIVAELEAVLLENIINQGVNTMPPLHKFIDRLKIIKEILINKHQSLYVDFVDEFINKVRLFGYHFATLDIRQDSRIHHNVLNNVVEMCINNKESDLFSVNYFNLSDKNKIEILSKINGDVDVLLLKDEMTIKTLNSIKLIKTIQQENREKGANRYIISNTQTSLNVIEVLSLFNLCGYNHSIPVDIIPLFETIDDLKNCIKVMEELYTNVAYVEHLKSRKLKQTIMLGFSDGTKDGGYLMANWSIFKAKEELTKISKKHNIKVIFFDGRGGPPARGGGKTHEFYASLGETIENEEIQLTVQGQTISSNFGTLDSSQYNLEQLLSSGISNKLLNNSNNSMNRDEIKIIDDLATISYNAYVDFKNHPKFLSYLENISTLKYYSKANIGSRPSKRSNSKELNLSDLRAIPFVGSWSQLKQNVPGFFGFGTALKGYDDKGKMGELKDLYKKSKFFSALIKNSMMSLSKCNFQLTQYMSDDKDYGSFWNIIYDEFKTTKKLILKISNHSELMQDNPVDKASIDLREDIVLPLLTIQQHSLIKIKELKKDKTANKTLLNTHEKIVMRSLFGNINASRNSV